MGAGERGLEPDRVKIGRACVVPAALPVRDAPQRIVGGGIIRVEGEDAIAALPDLVAEPIGARGLSQESEELDGPRFQLDGPAEPGQTLVPQAEADRGDPHPGGRLTPPGVEPQRLLVGSAGLQGLSQDQ